jgi:hypothetical protein
MEEYMADKKTSIKKPYALPKSGPAQAVIVDFIDLGESVEQFPGQDARVVEKVAFVFQVKEVNPDFGKRFEPGVEFTDSLGRKANLRKFLGDVRGKPLTDDEVEKGVALHEWVGKNAIITIDHATSAAGNKYAKIVGYSAPLEDMPAMKAEGYERSEHWGKKVEEYSAAVSKWKEENGVESSGLNPDVMWAGSVDDDDLPF